MNPRGSRAKGARGENEANKLLAEHFGLSEYDFHRMKGRDCVKSQAAKKAFPFHVEIKYREKLNLEKAFQQSKDEADILNEGPPVVIHRRNRTSWKITLELKTFLRLFFPQFSHKTIPPTDG